jgi:hypothetical protein
MRDGMGVLLQVGVDLLRDTRSSLHYLCHECLRFENFEGA